MSGIHCADMCGGMWLRDIELSDSRDRDPSSNFPRFYAYAPSKGLCCAYESGIIPASSPEAYLDLFLIVLLLSLIWGPHGDYADCRVWLRKCIYRFN